MKRFYLLLASVCAVATAHAQTVPFDATAPMRGGSQNQTAVPPVNPALNQSTIQGPPQVQRTSTSYDAQPSRLPLGTGPVAGTPEQSPTSVPDVREQGVIPQQRRRQSSDIVPSRSSSSSNVLQRRDPHPVTNSTQP
ncbi:hypothetical protein GCM10023172_08320 [Hymenobacter ginsengisoli]|uniref:Uncharacterized protein n=1 Tax=Hymenobacter ginsengisoli TaxID=1051626 RepID=A0ABP8Q010_9BACT|nr:MULTISPECIES: hypothetical protein [unclassified Hymenobacter]MBO2033705.1 hypothetical protein [Hymenobacter sp. BT559]